MAQYKDILTIIANILFPKKGAHQPPLITPKMKFSLLAFTSLSTLLNVRAFGVVPSSSVMSLRSPLTSSTVNMHFADEVEEAKGEEPKSGKAKTVYDRIGFEEDKVAMNVDANEVSVA